MGEHLEDERLSGVNLTRAASIMKAMERCGAFAFLIHNRLSETPEQFVASVLWHIIRRHIDLTDHYPQFRIDDTEQTWRRWGAMFNPWVPSPDETDNVFLNTGTKITRTEVDKFELVYPWVSVWPMQSPLTQQTAFALAKHAHKSELQVPIPLGSSPTMPFISAAYDSGMRAMFGAGARLDPPATTLLPPVPPHNFRKGDIVYMWICLYEKGRMDSQASLEGQRLGVDALFVQAMLAIHDAIKRFKGEDQRERIEVILEYLHAGSFKSNLVPLSKDFELALDTSSYKRGSGSVTPASGVGARVMGPV
jgi:hypothetical protein